VPVSVGRIGSQYWGITRSRGAFVQMATVRSNGYTHIPASIEGYEAGHELDVYLTTDPANIERTLIFSGAIDPILEELGNIAHDQGLFIHTGSAGNTGALLSLERNACHAAPMSLPAFSSLRECSFIRPFLDSLDLVFVNVASQEQGIAASKEISLDALDEVCWINSRRDSPARILFDSLLASHGISPTQIRGYTNEAATPGAIACSHKGGPGRCRYLFGRPLPGHTVLRFHPVSQEHYELVMRRTMLADPRNRHPDIPGKKPRIQNPPRPVGCLRYEPYRPDTGGDITGIGQYRTR